MTQHISPEGEADSAWWILRQKLCAQQAVQRHGSNPGEPSPVIVRRSRRMRLLKLLLGPDRQTESAAKACPGTRSGGVAR